ncbi:MAG: flagellar basal body L-ring protein FlgH [Gammaproteobacteria bacterium]|nr:flagellar basal body L-ring protein FlgH [Gammaproteobacteria bacterium]MBM4229314.1 flagellar basal body L-ring protein FlgH [Gammaproteobacteria bacterium]
MNLSHLGSIVVLTLIGGCAEIGVRDVAPERVYIPLNQASIPLEADGSIFSRAGQDSLLGNERSRRQGDLITVLIEEQVSASSSASSNASRNSATTALDGSALGEIDRRLKKAGIPWPVDINPAESAIESKGEGSAEQRGRITGSVTAVVTEVLPNGLLVIRGYKRMELARGAQIVRLTGLVRPSDIQPDNTVRSRRLADAEITFASKGELADASRSGWMNRTLLRLWPF